MLAEIILHSEHKTDPDRDFLIDRIAVMKDLPTLPVYVARISSMLRDENVNSSELVKALEHDPALVAHILKMINSGYFGLRIKIENVAQAAALLGISGIKQVIYSVAIMNIFGKEEAEEWAHSYSSSLLIGKIIRENNLNVASNLPITMLMHDLGKVALRRLIPSLWQKVLNCSHEKGIPVFEAEAKLFHLDHAEAGQIIMRNWQMPDEVIIPLAFHHIEDRLPEQFQAETALVQISNYIDCTARGIICHAPKPGFLKSAGLMGFDFDHWIALQQNTIPQLDRSF